MNAASERGLSAILAFQRSSTRVASSSTGPAVIQMECVSEYSTQAPP